MGVAAFAATYVACPKPTSILTATCNLSCRVAKTAISSQATTDVWAQTVSTPRELHRSACVGNYILAPTISLFHALELRLEERRVFLAVKNAQK